MTTPSQDQDIVFNGFLTQQASAGVDLTANSDLATVIPMTEGICNRYIVELGCVGLTRLPDGRIEKHDRWAFGVHFAEDYLARAVHVTSTLTFLGPKPLWHSNVNGPFVCLDLRAGTSLLEIIFALADLVSWRSFSLADPLNEDAAQWGRNAEPGVLPVDTRPLKWKAGQGVAAAHRMVVTTES